ncbi:SAV_915 family protein [Streptomyces sp. NPDC088348]|uniref:SAV_915 family protein n=1 Tax=Streptomyces sp. NPDC088348 TaxID=3365853 RepID=UPI003811D94A
MSTSARATATEPPEQPPAGPLYVPVRPGPTGCAARVFRTPPGVRTAVGFTSEARLRDTLGRNQAWIRLSEPALRALVGPLGIAVLTVDPQFSAPTATRSGRDERSAGAPGRTGESAVTTCLDLLIG